MEDNIEDLYKSTKKIEGLVMLQQKRLSIEEDKLMKRLKKIRMKSRRLKVLKQKIDDCKTSYNELFIIS
jgi:hypothetical protein